MKKVNLVFPGQGSQFVGMGKDFYDQFEQAKHRFHDADDVLGYKLSDICFNGPEDTLNQTQYTQVAIFLTSACILDSLSSLDINVQAYAGHSLGEITAYYAAGVIDFESALKIVIKRGELMGQAASKTSGSMAAIIGMDESTLSGIISEIPNVDIANYNSPVQFVISGESASVNTACDALTANGAKRVIPLPVSGAFHSPLMQSAVQPFNDYLNNFTFRDASSPIVLNRTAAAESNAGALKENLSYQIESSVQWIKCTQIMANSTDHFIEVGPGKVLSGLIKKIDREYSIQPTSTVDSLDQIRERAEV